MTTALQHGATQYGRQAKGFPFQDVLLRGLRWVRSGPLFRWRFSGFSPQDIAIVPLDLHFADPNLAHEFYHGRIALAGRVVQIGSLSPFAVEAPSPEWESALHDFSWLRHMDAAQTEIATAHARSLLSDWMASTDYWTRGIAWRGDVVGRRIISWLSHCDMLLNGATDTFRKRFMKSLGFQVRYLRSAITRMDDNEQRLLADLALNFAAIALTLSEKQVLQAKQGLERSLSRQILPDGGHISRNPATLLLLLSDMISLRQTYAASRENAPRMLIDSIERMLPALRFFLHRDKTLAHFNGVGPILPERLELVLSLDETDAALFSRAPHSGYQRLAMNDTTIIADTGHIPPRFVSQRAHAGCLAFEMSSGTNRFIINCGIDPYGPAEYHLLGRSTAAHSTATLNDTSSCRFQIKNKQTVIASGPTDVKIERIEAPDRLGFIASHNGYATKFKLIHERGIVLGQNGTTIDGFDRFFNPGQDRATNHSTHQAVLRFHLHPDVEVSHHSNGALRLEVKAGDAWLFSSPDMAAQIEDSIYLSGMNGPLRTRQIVLHFKPAEMAKLRWRLERIT